MDCGDLNLCTFGLDAWDETAWDKILRQEPDWVKPSVKMYPVSGAVNLAARCPCHGFNRLQLLNVLEGKTPTAWNAYHVLLDVFLSVSASSGSILCWPHRPTVDCCGKSVYTTIAAFTAREAVGRSWCSQAIWFVLASSRGERILTFLSTQQEPCGLQMITHFSQNCHSMSMSQKKLYTALCMLVCW